MKKRLTPPKKAPRVIRTKLVNVTGGGIGTSPIWPKLPGGWG